MAPGIYVAVGVGAWTAEPGRRILPRLRYFFIGSTAGVMVELLGLRVVYAGLFPRSLVPFIPLVFTAVGLWILSRGSTRSAALAVVASGVVGLIVWVSGIAWILRDGRVLPEWLPFVPYYEAVDFDPSKTVALLDSTPPDTLLVAANADERLHDSFALYYAAIRAGYARRFVLLSALRGRDARHPRREHPLLLVSRRSEDLAPMCRVVGGDPARARPMKLRGFYKAWLVAAH